jgi:methionine aminotransferase
MTRCVARANRLASTPTPANTPPPMPEAAATFPSRLPAVGTTIFTVMSRLAAECGALNLSQGFPDFSPDPALLSLVEKHLRSGANQYAPMAGVPALREAIAVTAEALSGTRYDPEHEVTVTAGGTQAIFTAITCAVRPGDEALIFEPAYDCYAPAIELAGGTVVRAQLRAPDYRPDWAEVAGLLSPRTRLVIINSPHNPTGSVWAAADLDRLAALLRGSQALVVSDEVYEHMVFDGRRHQGCAGHRELAARSFVVGSFGKTFHATGWKIGFVLAPRPLTAELRKVHQFVVFAVNTPIQLALAEFLREPAHYLGLAAFYQARRDRFRAGLASTRLTPLACAGTYFQLVSYAEVSDEPDAALAERLTREFKVASIPVSVFYAVPRQDRVLRFCFAKELATLDRACERLAKL